MRKVKSVTITISRDDEDGFIATVNKGGKWNPIPLGRRRYTGDIDKVLKNVNKRVKELLLPNN